MRTLRRPPGTAPSTPHARRDAPGARWVLLAGLWLMYFCFGLTTAGMAPLVAPIAADLRLSHAAMGGVLGAWPLVYIVSAAPAGMVLDRLGVRVSLALAAAVIALSNLLRAVAVDHLGLYVAVAVFGLGGPLISVGAPKLIALAFEGNDRGLAMGVFVTGPAVGGVTALALTHSVLLPLLGGWRRVLAAYAIFVIGAGAAWLAVSAGSRHTSVDGTEMGEPPSRLGGLADLVATRPVRLVLLMSVGIFFVNHGLNNWLPEILRTGGMDATAAGWWASIPTVAGIAASLVVPRAAVPARRLAVLGTLFAAGAVATLLILRSPGPMLAGALVVHGITRGSAMAMAVLLLMDMPGVRADAMGATVGLFFAVAEIGGVLGPLTMGVLYDRTGTFASPLHVQAAVCLALVGVVAALRRTGAGGEMARGRRGRRPELIIAPR